MSNEQATPATEENKKHGDELESAVSGSPAGSKNNAVPAAEDGGHPLSVAAHLHEHAHLHDNKNAIQHHVTSNELRQPPQEVTRTGKGHRGE